MKRILLLLTIYFLITSFFCCKCKAAQPTWIPSEDTQYNMVIFGTVYDDQNQSLPLPPSSIIGAFGPDGDNDCRAIYEAREGDDPGYYYLTVCADIQGEIISFKAYDSGNNKIYNLTETITFFDSTDHEYFVLHVKPEPEIIIPPEITSGPPCLVVVENKYQYQPEATGDPLIIWSLDDGAPDGMTIDPNSGFIQWTPDPNQIGEYELTIQAQNEGGSDSDDFRISVSPKLISTPPSTVEAGQVYSYSPIVIGTGLTVWELITEPTEDGLTIESTTGQITWTPTSEQVGTVEVTLNATVNGQQTVQIWDITVISPNSQVDANSNVDDSISTKNSCFLSLLPFQSLFDR